ncbi:Bgt-20833 [Blumeria graminis f. sp. tritici]|uniref:Bgt-20833 n=2 Tax=Blumeria graminis f. sp. tritici TaxID=62690 RepID=A0A9X9MK55_BLUGR|nr:Bgt-20833 [Blumeria graminis f. sp. tritici]
MLIPTQPTCCFWIYFINILLWSGHHGDFLCLASDSSLGSQCGHYVIQWCKGVFQRSSLRASPYV